MAGDTVSERDVADPRAGRAAAAAVAPDGSPMLVFGRSPMARWVAGSKTATVISVRPDVVVGGVVTVASPGGIARLPMRVVQCLPLDELGVLPLVAERAGVGLSQFTVCRSWEAYVKTLSEQRVVSFPARVLVLEVAGELIGKIPPKKRPEPKRKRQPPAPPKLKPAPTTPKKQDPKKKQPSPQQEKKVKATWVQVGFAPVPITPQTVVHPRDLAVLGQRISAVMSRRQPALAARRALAPVVGALLEKGVAGPAGLERADQERLRGRIDTAVAWLSQHQLLVRGAWNPKLLVGLRVRAEGVRG